MRVIHSLGHVVGGTLLIAGTTIGVGMLALPVVTAAGGFIPSVTVYFLCWLFMLCTGLLIVEVSLSMPKETSFISMADKLLGPVGKGIYWVVYLFLFVTVMIAHVAGGGAILQEITGSPLPSWISTVIYVLVFAPVVYLGTHSVDRLNLLLISGVILCYAVFVSVSIGHVNFELLTYSRWGQVWGSVPVLFTAFTYQVIIPTLINYMERNVKKIRLAVILGSSIPLVIYLLWEFVILGIIPPEGPGGLIEAAKAGMNAVGPLKQFVQNPYISKIGNYFAFFTLTTSFIPLALAFYDFMADGLKWEKKGIKREILCIAIFGGPLVIALVYPDIFLVALGYAGGISCAFLFGFMPPILAWVSRYIKRYPIATRQLPGGKSFLILLMIIAIFILTGEILQSF